MALDDKLGNALEFLALLLELLVRAAPLLGGIRGQLAAVDRKVLFADETQRSPRGIKSSRNLAGA